MMKGEGERAKLGNPAGLSFLPDAPRIPRKAICPNTLVLLVFSPNSPIAPPIPLSFTLFTIVMSETFQELADIPKDFVREGSLFIRRCTKRTSISPWIHRSSLTLLYS